MLKHFSKFRRAIAALYVFIVVSVSVLCVFYYSYINRNTYDSVEQTMQHLNALMAHGMRNLVNEQESLITILGHELLKTDPNLNDKLYIRAILDKLVVENQNIVAIGIATIDGQLHVISGIDLSRTLPNFVDYPETKDSFLKTTQTTKLIIGRTHMVPFLNNGAGAWVIPVRKMIEFNGKKLVIAIGLSLKMYANDWKQSSLAQKTHVYIIRSDGYLQFTNNYDLDLETAYNKKYDVSCKDKDKNTLLKINCVFTKHEVLAVVSYDPRTDYYTLVTMPVTELESLREKEYIFLLYVYLGLIGFATIVYIFVAKLTDGYELNLLTQATHDSLTKLPNRASLHDELDRRINIASNNDNEVALFFIDLDDFKHINDTHNHFVGDKLLIEVANRLTSVLRKTDFVARLGGDEFVVVVSNHDNRRRKNINVFTIANAIKDALNEPINIIDIPLTTNASIGIARYPLDATDTTDLLRKADLAMYESKKQGKNLSIVYNPMLEYKTLEEYELRASLKHAVKNNEFNLVYQTQVDPNTNEAVGLEALVRWSDKSITPDVFVPLLEQMHLINELGRFVFKQAIKDFAAYTKAAKKNGCCNPDNCILALNMSPLQMKDKELIIELINELEYHNISPKQVEIEITESALIHEALESKAVERMHSAGFSIAIDDFGTGYSNLRKLNTLPINVIKIDQSFIQQIGTDEKAESVIMSIIGLAEKIGINIIAEGVETNMQLDFLLSNWKNIIIQGYYYSKPKTIEEIITQCSIESIKGQNDEN